MGTHANLAVRNNGKTYYQHTSYDGSIKDVLPQLMGTLAACGYNALKNHLDMEGEPGTDEDQSNHHYLDRKAMGNAYLLSSNLNGKTPYNLDFAMMYEFSKVDFAHGGIIPLLAPDIDWHPGACERIEDANFILDLDRGVFVVPSWDIRKKHENYDNQTLKTLLTISLNSIQGSNPEMLADGLSQVDYDGGEKNGVELNATIEDVIAKAKAGEICVSKKRGSFFKGQHIHSRDTFRPSIHRLIGLPDHVVYTQAVIDFLRENNTDFHVLGEDKNIVISSIENDEHTLVVDLRSGDVATYNMISELFCAVAKANNMIYTMQSEHGGFVFTSTGWQGLDSFGTKEHAWDEGLIAEDAEAVGLTSQKEAMTNKVIKSGNLDLAHYLTTLAIIGLDSEQWAKIEKENLTFHITPEMMSSIMSITVNAAVYFEKACPGNTAKRWARLTRDQQDAAMNVMAPIDSYIFHKLLELGKVDLTQKI